ncbi:MAG TPA: phosphoglucosamine mutase, partial [Candidatus Eisenbacteria bacterium]|nr:phosphoglucosamine mutase [Candidatus Eisenbacteria bacterium]
MNERLVTGVSGIRGVVGEALTPAVLVQVSGAFAAFLGPGPIVFGRDSRPTGDALRHVVTGALRAAGRDVLDVGIVPTPTVQLEVERQHAAGGLALTASHNPIQWNALKLVGSDGRFLSPERAQAFLAIAFAPVKWPAWDQFGGQREIPDAVDHHVDRILDLPEVDADRVGKARLRVVVDAVHGAGGAIARRLLERLGADAMFLYEDPTGRFPRDPEPRAENLGALAEAVREHGADLGIAFDPDVDRLSLVDETGRAIGEECTLPLAADHVLGVQRGNVVTNLSTSARLETVAARHEVQVTRTPVGEANVVQGILEANARVGGEGNGGVILPRLHLGRDAPAAAALVLTGLAVRGTGLSAWTQTLPELFMVKEKLEIRGEPDWERLRRDMLEVWGAAREDRRDGLWMAGDGEWVHVRKSGTEPVVRVIAEAGTSA